MSKMFNKKALKKLSERLEDLIDKVVHGCNRGKRIAEIFSDEQINLLSEISQEIGFEENPDEIQWWQNGINLKCPKCTHDMYAYETNVNFVMFKCEYEDCKAEVVLGGEILTR